MRLQSDPLSAIHALLGAPRTEPLRIIELGAGTGIATRLLIAEAHRFGGLERLYALDPSQGMRSALQDTLFGPGGVVADLQKKQSVAGADVRVGDGTFEHFDAPPDNDLVVIAQAFHWCPDFDAALRSIAAHLRPGGVLALLWNLEDRSAPWVGRVRDRYELYEQGTPQYRHMHWHAMFKTAAFKEYFRAAESMHIKRSLPTTEQGVIALPDTEKEGLSADVRRILSDAEHELDWLDKAAGVWNYPYQTDLCLFHRI